MNDKFMSGWGCAQNKINKLVIECDTWEDAQTIKRNAMKREEMKYISVSSRFPALKSYHYLSLKKFEDLGEIWTK